MVVTYDHSRVLAGAVAMDGKEPNSTWQDSDNSHPVCMFKIYIVRKIPPTRPAAELNRVFVKDLASRVAGTRKMPESHSTQRVRGAAVRAFTMIEVLVSISILIFLASMLLPGLGAARERARRLMCKNNLRQWSVAFHAYRHEWNDFLPMEGSGTETGRERAGAWYNQLPFYLDLPAYKDLDRIEDQIKELPALHVWICPSKNMTSAYKSGSGKNQFHYAMNWVLDGLGSKRSPSRDTPDFMDMELVHQPAGLWSNRPTTVLMFDIAWNSPGGTPRDVATKYQRDWQGRTIGRFHGDYANLLYMNGSVANCSTDDLVRDRDFRRGDIVWRHPRLYWGYLPKPPQDATNP